MGTFTPNIGLFIPAPGETNYNDSFAQGMINLDQHDHTGGPNKGLPITSSGLADFSVTFRKLNSNVADVTTGIGTNSSPSLQNQLQILGILRNLFTLSSLPGNVGFVAMNGSTVAARTFQDSATVTWTNPSGIAGDPIADVDVTGIFPVTVPDGGLGVTSLTPYGIITGGTTGTGNAQQVAVGNAGEVLTSQGAGTLPLFQSLASLGQIQYANVTLTALQITQLVTTRIEIVPAPGANKILVPLYCYALLTYATTPFSSGSSLGLALTYADALITDNIVSRFSAKAFNGVTQDVIVWSAPEASITATGGVTADVVNQPLKIRNTGTSYSGGGTSTVKFIVAYVTIDI